MEASSIDVQQDFGNYRERADGSLGTVPEPVTVLHHDRPSVVIVAADEYARLKRRDKMVLANEEVPATLVDLIARTEMDPSFAHLDQPG